MSNIFSSVEVLSVPRSFFKIPFSVRTTYNFGKLYPSFFMDCVPSDVVKVKMASMVKAQPMAAPSMTPVNMTTHFFFVPYRLLDENFTDAIAGIITSGVNKHKAFNYEFPLWEPDQDKDIKVGSLWDYFGLPINVSDYMSESGATVLPTYTKGFDPSAYLKRAYNLVYNTMYRDENFIDEIDLDSNDILYRAWRPDYFTKALPYPQVPMDIYSAGALPISATSTSSFNLTSGDLSVDSDILSFYSTQNFKTNTERNSINGYHNNSSSGNTSAFGVGSNLTASTSVLSEYLTTRINTDTLVTGANINAIRFAAQMQKWAERNARSGSLRYDEFVKAHFGVFPGDTRLQLPEFIGGFKTPIMIGDSLQTSASSEGSTAQGNRVGIGNAVGGDSTSTYHVKEYGCIIGITSIIPQAEYMQGMNRTFVKRDRLDFLHHEFCCLGEQEVNTAEVVCSSDSVNAEKSNTTVFGFQGRYNEYRFFNNLTTGQMRTTYQYWHASRVFDPSYDTVNDHPKTVLGKDFIECSDSSNIRPFSNWNPDYDPFNVESRFLVKAYRPITKTAIPGLVDHF